MFRDSGSSGFSLLELSVALCLAGLFLATCLQAYTIFNATHTKDITGSVAIPIQVALQNFVAINHRYPCPSDPALPDSDLKAGIEFCSVPPVVDPGVPQSSGGWPGGGGIVRTLGARNSDMPSDGKAGHDSVLIGAVPYVTLGLSPRETHDVWNKQLGYAVTDALAMNIDPNPVPTLGTIQLTDYYGLSVSPVVASTPLSLQFKKDQHLFVIWSYGSSQRGAYSPRGIQTFPCDLTMDNTDPATGGGSDRENCDNDAYFLDAKFPANNIEPWPAALAQKCQALHPGVIPVQNTTKIQADDCGSIRFSSSMFGTSPAFYDSTVLLYMLNPGSDNWSLTSTGGVVKAINTGQGKVGIATQYPQYGLDVTGSVRAHEVLASQFCSLDPANPACFSTQKMGGSGFNANTVTGVCSGAFIAGIAGNKPKCATLPPGVMPASACGSGQFAAGISATGTLICINAPP